MRALVIVVCVGLLTGSATAEDRKAAERFFRAGAKAYAAQNFRAAATNFDEAYRAFALPEIAFSAAQAYRRLYAVDANPAFVRRAIELYQAYLSAVKTGGRVGDAADNLQAMKNELDKLERSGVKTSSAVVEAVAQTRLGINVSRADQATGELGALREIGDVTNDVLPGLVATIDGSKVEPFALVVVDAREHLIGVSADGYFPVEKKAVAVAGQSLFVDVELRPRPARLVVQTEEDARISIDGRFVATTPTAPLEVAPGKHLVTVVRRGRYPFATELMLGRGDEVPLRVPLQASARRRAVPWVLGAAGLLLAGAATTGGFALARDGEASDLRDQIDAGNRPPGDADALEAAVSSRDRLVLWTWILGGAAVAAGGTGAFLLYFDRPSPDSGTVGVSGRF